MSRTGVESRVHPRQTVMRRGMVMHTETGRGFRCIIVDISAGGAKLQLFAPGLPGGLVSLLDLAAGVTHDVRVVWRAGPLIGVCFVSSESLP